MNANADIKPLYPTGSGSRIRLSAGLLTTLGWIENKEQFDCIGFFRKPGELIIAPMWLKTSDGTHPFEPLLELTEQPSTTEIGSIIDIPSTKIIIAPNRITKFNASWTTNYQQLDLKLGVKVTRSLGCDGDKTSPIFPASWGSILLLISETVFNEANAEDLLPKSSRR